MNQLRFLGLLGRFLLLSGLMAVGLLALAGCESERPGVPPASTESVLPPSDSEATIPTLGLVLTETNPIESAYFDTYLRAYAARADVILAVANAKAGEQGQAVRDLAAEPLSALIVVPETNQPPTQELAEARDQGIPVVLLGQSVEIDPPITSVRLEPLENAAKPIVSEVVEAAEKAGAAPDSPAVILLAEGMGQAGLGRVKAFRTALAATSHPALPEVTYDPSVPTNAAEALRSVLREHEDLSVVLAVEEQGLLGAAMVLDERKEPKPPMAIGGFFGSRDLVMNPVDPSLTAVGDLDPRDLAGRAFETAMTLAKGETVSKPVELKITIRRPSEPNPAPEPRPTAPVEPGSISKD